MTKKIAISVPDDVAERLAREPNVSAYVTDSLRRRMAYEITMRTLAQMGQEPTPQQLAEAESRITDAQRRMTPELRAQAGALLEVARRGR